MRGFARFHRHLGKRTQSPRKTSAARKKDEEYVTEINWRSTQIRKLSNNTVVIPNSQLVASMLTNYYLPAKDLAVPVEMGVSTLFNNWPFAHFRMLSPL